MNRKVFISFLGNSIYKQCVYEDRVNKQNTGVVTFIQHGLVKLYCKNWTAQDKVFLFLTQDAADKNWKKLNEDLKALQYQVSIEPIFDVPEGTDETQLWAIFEKVYYKLERHDKIIFDITHSFRSLPMLGMVLSNYARFLLETDVVRVCYGAFEKLGAAYNIETRIPNAADRIAPIINLTSLVQLQKWTSAADIFIHYGKGHRINSLLDTPIEELNTILENFATSRGGQLIRGDLFTELTTKIAATPNLVKPFQPILEKIKNKVAPFQKWNPELLDDHQEVKKMIFNTLNAVQWCIDHSLVQQGFTLLQEGIITIVLTELKKSYQDKTNRTIVSSCFSIWDKPETKWKGEAAEQIELTRSFLRNTGLFREINSKRNPYYTKISVFRNDLNHAGFMHDANQADKIVSKLPDYYEKISKILDGYFNLNSGH